MNNNITKSSVIDHRRIDFASFKLWGLIKYVG